MTKKPILKVFLTGKKDETLKTKVENNKKQKKVPILHYDLTLKPKKDKPKPKK
jgi:hypothetical protein